MANLLSRLRSTTRSATQFPELSFDQFLEQVSTFSFNGGSYPFGLNTTFGKTSTTEFSPGIEGHLLALMTSPPAFAAQWTRSLVLSQARFAFRNLPYTASGRKLFGTPALSRLERPWPNGTTGNLITHMEWHAGLAGNAYVLNRGPRLKVLRPDWITIVYGSRNKDVALDRWDLEAELLGYVYYPGGRRGEGAKPEPISVEEMAHWSPIPDPLGQGIGMSWLTPVIREIQGDIAATTHKLKFFENGATPNLVVKGIPATSKTAFDEIVEAMEAKHRGLRNAYKTLYLTAGADATPVGANLADLDLKGVQGSHETRIAAASKVPAAVLNISEGLAGSALNAGNFSAARRNFSDTWVFPTLTDLCGALGTIVKPPSDLAELYFDTTDMPFLREDAKDASAIRKDDAVTIRELLIAGFEPDAAVAYVQSGGDLGELTGKHTGLFSIQLQPPGTVVDNPAAGDANKPGVAAGDATPPDQGGTNAAP